MAAAGISTVPAVFKPIASYYKLASDNDTIDPVIGYWCRLYVCQKAMKIDSKSPEARTFLVALMDELEQVGNFHAKILHSTISANRRRKPYWIMTPSKMRRLPKHTLRTMHVKFSKVPTTKIEVETRPCK